MKKRMTAKEIALISVTGGIWVAVENTLGIFLHLYHVPFKGVFLAAFGFSVMLSMKKYVPRPGSIMLAAGIAVLIRLLSTGSAMINACAAMALEAAGWEIIAHYLSGNLLRGIAGGIWNGTVCSVMPALRYLIFSGAGINEVVEIYLKQAAFCKNILPFSLNPVLIFLILQYSSAMVLSYAAVRLSLFLTDRLEKSGYH